MFKGFNNILKAKVVSIDDPKSLGRVQVYIPCYHGRYDSGMVSGGSGSQYPWAQVCTRTPVIQGLPQETSIGSPSTEIGEWVWIEFEGGDSRVPVCIGSVAISSPIYDVSTWTDITKVINFYKHIIGLKSDGTVIATGDNTFKQCNVSTWTNITDIFTNRTHTVGLKTDGTVVATGNNTFGQCNVTSWTNISGISIGEYFTIGIKSDGTTVITVKS